MEEAVLAVAHVSEVLGCVEQRLDSLFPLLSDLSSVPPLQRAAIFLSLSKALNALFSLHLRCQGLPAENLTFSEVERVSLYDDKIGHFIDDMKGPKQRTTVINVAAANRVIEHALPDLTEEQRKDFKRPCAEPKNGPRKQRNLLSMPLKPTRTVSISEAAAAFLEAAQKELVQDQKIDEAT